jgi:tetratricopeptide (TPR) repeat protein
MGFDYKVIDPLIEKGNIIKNREYIYQDEIVKAFKILEKYCSSNPNDYEAKLSLAVFATDFPLYDDFTAIDILNELLLIKDYYVKALVVKAKIETTFRIIAEDTFQLIEKYLSSNSTTASYYGEMLMHKAFYFRTFQRYEEMGITLLKSIKISPNFAWNYMLLGDLMVKKKDDKKALVYYEKAINNTTLVGSNNFYGFPYNFEALLDVLLRGTTQWLQNYNRLVKDYSDTMERILKST